MKLNRLLPVWQKHHGHLTNYQFLIKRNQQKIEGQTIDKTMAKPVGVVKNQEKPIICARHYVLCHVAIV